LQNVLADCRSLTKLVNQLLLLAEAEADSDVLRGKRSPTNFGETVRHACAMFERLAADKGIDIEIANVSDCWVSGNRNLLSQVVYNLLDNAIKFSLPESKITVELSSTDGQNECRLVIADTGSGIPREDLPKITERFFSGRTVADKTESSRSSGLGLSICDTIIASHDGTLSIESTPEVGTTVTIVLPTMSVPSSVLIGST
jgi:signal transduction histidine kinase